MKAATKSVSDRRLGRASKGTVRPTSARVRTALFDMLAARGLKRAKVLDLYAGLGTLGMEAIRSGAQSCDFVESDTRLCSTLKTSLESMGLRERGRVFCMKVGRALVALEGPYDIVFMDPPYEMRDLEETVVHLAKSELIAEGGLLVVEHSKRVGLSDNYGEMRHWRNRRYGDTILDIYTKGEV